MVSRSAVISSQIDVGPRTAIVTSAAGCAYLAAASAEKRAAVLADAGSDAAARRRLKNRLEATIAECRALGYATSFREWSPHINALGVSLTGCAENITRWAAADRHSC